jgi:flagellar motility protein MotE (MotC chaperone)
VKQIVMQALLSRFRLLPITLFAASLMLTVKLGAIWSDLGNVFDTSISITSALAESAAKQNGDAVEPDGERPRDENQAVARMSPSNSGTPSGPEQPQSQSPSEIELLDQLAERRKKLDGWEREIAERDALLKAAETRIDQKVRELKAMQGTLDGLIKVYDQQQDGQIRSLVKIYENMKPKDAARIFQELDMETLLLVAERMKERKLAPIMAQMNPAKAKQVTVELARLRRMEQHETAAESRSGGA